MTSLPTPDKMEGKQMTMNKYHPLADWLDTLPEPETVEEIALCAYSDAIDEIAMALAEFRVKQSSSQRGMNNEKLLL